MEIFNAKQYVELFHLLFLEQLGKKLDKKLYALKGGCNLRFFFHSIRYSEDIDLDTRIIAKQTLQNKVDTILSSPQFHQILRSRKIEIHSISSPKQTETTQRWKISLKTPFSQFPLPTKIEFSKRKFAEDVQFTVVDPILLQQYHLPPMMLNHYSAEEACAQKIAALIFRSQTQARDIFDLYLLMGSGIKPVITDKKIISHLDEAKNNVLSVSFEDFYSQVLSYLSAEYQKQYDDKDVWGNMVKTVLNALESI